MSTANTAGRDPVHIDDPLVRMRHLIDSTEPAIVFSTLVRVCVPMFCDAATVDIVEGGRVRYRIGYPQQAGPGADDWPEVHEISTAFESHQAGWPSYTGTLCSRWFTRAATAQDEARAAKVVDYVVDMISQERAADPTRSIHSHPAAPSRRGASHR